MILALVAMRAGVFLLTLVSSSDPSADAVRAAALSSLHGRPYLDYEAEYPPLGLALRIAIGRFGSSPAHVAVAVLAFGSDLLIIRLLGRRRLAYLLVTTPLLPLLYERLELVGVAITVSAIVTAERGRERLGAFLLAAATLDKLWPALIAPWFLVESKRRAALWTAAVASAGLVTWAALTHGQGPTQVLTFRHASGWNIESTPGIVAWLIEGGHPAIEQGSPRIGAVNHSVLAGLLVAQAGLCVLGWALAWRGPVRDPAMTATFVTAAALVLSPLFSPQFVLWMVPWASMTGQRDAVRATMLVTVATGAIAAMNQWGGPIALYQGLVAWRILVLVVVCLIAARAAALRSSSARAAERCSMSEHERPRVEDPNDEEQGPVSDHQ